MCAIIGAVAKERDERERLATEALAVMLERANLMKVAADSGGNPAYSIDRDGLRKFVKYHWSVISVCAHTIHGDGESPLAAGRTTADMDGRPEFAPLVSPPYGPLY